MTMFITALRGGALLVFAVALLHVSIGPEAEVLLGAQIPADVITEPALDSQNRFYGVSFALFGVVLWLGANDLERYATLVWAVLALLFLGGIARLVSWAIVGAPPAPIIGLLAIEFVAPIAFGVALRRVQSTTSL